MRSCWESQSGFHAVINRTGSPFSSKNEIVLGSFLGGFTDEHPRSSHSLHEFIKTRTRFRHLPSSLLEPNAPFRSPIAMMSTSTSHQYETIVSCQETIAAMRHQEASGYQVVDFLSTPSVSLSHHAPLHFDINADSRAKIVQWTYSLVDYLKFDREVCAISINILDRFMSTPHADKAKTSREVYQLAAMTSLYTAVKIHQPEAIAPSTLAHISRGTYTAKQIEDMETEMLMALSWRVNPPTAQSFVRETLTLISQKMISQKDSILDDDEDELDSYLLETVYDLARCQIEAAVAEYSFVTVPSSVLAYGSLMNAFLAINALSEGTLYNIWDLLSQQLLLGGKMNNQYSNDKGALLEIQSWLHDIVVQQPTAQEFQIMESFAPRATASKTLQRTASCEFSPRTVVSAQM